MRLCISPSRRTYTTYWPVGEMATPAALPVSVSFTMRMFCALKVFSWPWDLKRTTAMAALPEPLEEIFADEPDGGDGGAATAVEFAPEDPAAAVGTRAELKFSVVLICVLLGPESRWRGFRSVRRSAAVW